MPRSRRPVRHPRSPVSRSSLTREAGRSSGVLTRRILRILRALHAARDSTPRFLCSRFHRPRNTWAMPRTTLSSGRARSRKPRSRWLRRAKPKPRRGMRRTQRRRWWTLCSCSCSRKGTARSTSGRAESRRACWRIRRVLAATSGSHAECRVPCAAVRVVVSSALTASTSCQCWHQFEVVAARWPRPGRSCALSCFLETVTAGLTRTRLSLRTKCRTRGRSRCRPARWCRLWTTAPGPVSGAKTPSLFQERSPADGS